MKKTCIDGYQTSNFAKAFSLKSFLLYSSFLLKISPNRNTPCYSSSIYFFSSLIQLWNCSLKVLRDKLLESKYFYLLCLIWEIPRYSLDSSSPPPSSFQRSPLAFPCVSHKGVIHACNHEFTRVACTFMRVQTDIPFTLCVCWHARRA